MRARLTVLGAAFLLSGCGGSSGSTTTQPSHPPPGPPPPTTVTAGQVKARLFAPTRAPKVNAKWRYRFRVTDTRGRRLPGKITVQIVDPLGQAHAVTYDDTKRPIRNMAFRGDFQDYVEYPADARGFTLTFRVIARTGRGSVTITYPITPK